MGRPRLGLRITSSPLGSVYFSNWMRGMSAEAAAPRFCADDVVRPAIASSRATNKDMNARVYMTVTLPRSLVVETCPEIQAGDGAVGARVLPQPSQTDRRGREAQLICTLDGFDDTEVPHRQDVRPMQPEHQEHLGRPAPDALHTG